MTPPPSLTGQQFISIAAGTGAVNATASAGQLRLNTITSAGNTVLTAAAGNIQTSSITSSGSVNLGHRWGSEYFRHYRQRDSDSDQFVEYRGGRRDHRRGAVTLTSSSNIGVSNVTTGGRAFNATSSGGRISTSAVDTRLSGGPTGVR